MPPALTGNAKRFLLPHSCANNRSRHVKDGEVSRDVAAFRSHRQHERADHEHERGVPQLRGSSSRLERRPASGAIIDAAQRVGLTLEEIRDLLGSHAEPEHERLRQLAVLKLPELDELIDRATAVRRVLRMCGRCDCESIDVCHMFDDRVLPLHEHTITTAARRAGRQVAADA